VRSTAGDITHSAAAITTSSTAYITGTKRKPPGTSPPNRPAAGTSAISDGPTSFVTEAPTLPAPNVPSATPCFSRGNQAAFQAMPTEKALPLMPKHSA
jgi:hypothetical protein